MPINESQGYHLHSNLTPTQQREAMEAIYGGNVTPTQEQTDLTFEEVERLRRILDRYDKSQAGARKEFDLAKPPVPPYKFQPFPFLMYHHATGKTQVARSSLEQTALIAEGWSVDPFRATPAPEPPQLTAQETEEAARVDTLLKMPPEEFESMVSGRKKKS